MAARSARSWNFSKYFGLFQWEKIIFGQNAYFCLKMIFRTCFFLFFFRTLRVGWVGFEKCGKFCTFFFLKPSLKGSFTFFKNIHNHLKKTIYQKNCKFGSKHSTYMYFWAFFYKYLMASFWALKWNFWEILMQIIKCPILTVTINP